jgi:hypothetical protein
MKNIFPFAKKLSSFFFVVFATFFLVSCSADQDVNVHPHQQGTPLEKEVVYRFDVVVNTANPNIPGSTGKDLVDKGLVILPKGYSQHGVPAKLVIYCHGGSGYVSNDFSESESDNYCKYLVSLGYAVLDMNGIPELLVSNLKIDRGRTVGNFTALRSYVAGYEYVMNNFNIDFNGCYVFANSNGGLISMNLANLTSIPIIAQAGINPMLSIERNLWNYKGGAVSLGGGEFSSLQNRANVIRLYGMNNVKTQAELNDAIYEKEKVKDYDPFDYLMFKAINDYPYPYKIFQTKDDGAVSFSITKELVVAMQKRGDNLNLREIETGGHVVEPQKGVVGYYRYQFIDNNLTPTVLEVAEWFEYNEGYKAIFFN